MSRAGFISPLSNRALGEEMHPFSGSLISGLDSASWLCDALQHTQTHASLCSAYLRSEALDRVVAGRPWPLLGRVLVRWQLGDLLAGASDLKAYSLAKSLGLSFAIRLDFHGKVFAVPDHGIVVGSANATLSGFGFSADSNAEVCTYVPATHANLSLIDALFAGATLMTDALFNRMQDAFERAKGGGIVDAKWPETIMEEMSSAHKIDQLLVSECLSGAPMLDGNTVTVSERDCRLLGLPEASVPVGVAVQHFRHSRIYRWLHEYLRFNGGEAHFGALTAALHDVLLDDPRVYRSEVKQFLQILLDWTIRLPQTGISVDRPRYSQRVRLLQE